jgi:hypothetical protein
VKSQGRGGADNDGFHTRSDQNQTACAKEHAFLSRDELEVAPGAALAYPHQERPSTASAALDQRDLVEAALSGERSERTPPRP